MSDKINANGQLIDAPPSQAALQQAMRLHFGLTYNQIASLLAVHPRTVWQHVNRAEQGAHLRAWEHRTETQRKIAIGFAYLKARGCFKRPDLAQAKSGLDFYSVMSRDDDGQPCSIYTLL